MAIVIVLTIHKNGGNAGVLGASFSCAVFGVRGSSGGNAGAAGNGGQSQSRFQSDGGLSRLRFDRQLRFAAARIRIFWKLGRQNERRFVVRALFNWGGFVRFNWGNRFSWSFCLQA